MGWSRILDTSLGRAAKAQYDSDPRRHYHGWQHIEDLYWAAEHLYGFAYDYDLDRAILTHDVIFDEHPRKELRSGKWLLDHDMSDGVENAFDHIMKTAKLQISDDNRMLLLDFARLRNNSSNLEDRNKLVREAADLEGKTASQFSHGVIGFFTSILPRFSDSQIAGLPRMEQQAFREIRAGMEFSIEHSQMLEGEIV